MSDNPDIYWGGGGEFISNGKTRRQIIIKKTYTGWLQLRNTHTHRNENSISLDYVNRDLELTVNKKDRIF